MSINSASSVKIIRVLLAEDGLDNQRLIALILKTVSMEVVVADNGQIAYDKAMSALEAGEPFDVILMDMQMPVLDGVTATRKLRAAGYQGAIISLTANAMESDSKRCLDAGCNDFACKPVNREKLIQTIKKHAALPAVEPQAVGDVASNKTPLISDFADDPDMAELVDEYVANMPKRVNAIRDALAQGEMDQLNTLAHQVKGSAGGYGFDPISQQAGILERCLFEQAQLDQIRTEVDALLELCNRASMS